jgi:hypothetical protein
MTYYHSTNQFKIYLVNSSICHIIHGIILKANIKNKNDGSTDLGENYE